MVCTFTLNTNPLNPLREYFSCDQMVYVGADTGKNSGGKKSGGGKMTLQCRQENGEKQEEMALHPSCIAGKAKRRTANVKVMKKHHKVRDFVNMSLYHGVKHRTRFVSMTRPAFHGLLLAVLGSTTSVGQVVVTLSTCPCTMV